MSAPEVLIGAAVMASSSAVGVAAPYCRWGAPIMRAWGRMVSLVEPKPVPACCPHRSTVPVEDVHGETVARLCLLCDEQLAADWRPSFSVLFFDPDLIEPVRRWRL